MYSVIVFYVLTFITACAAAPSAVHNVARHHSEHARRAQNTTFELSKRFSSTRWTYYAPGLGACGTTNGPSDFIVALNQAQWNGGSHCYETITMSYGGKTTTAQIVDLCPGCPYGGLDLSPSLFSFFGSQALGVLSGNWNFGGSSGGGSNGGGNSGSNNNNNNNNNNNDNGNDSNDGDATPTSSKSAPKSTPPPAPAPAATSHSAKPKATSTTSSTPSSASSASVAGAAAASGVPSNPLYTTQSVPSAAANGNLADIYLALAQLGTLAEDA